MTQPTDAALFAAAGRALFGDRWAQPTAQLLGWPLDAKGQNRTIQRIRAAVAAGEPYDIDPAILRDLGGHLMDRATVATQLAAEIQKRGG